MISRMQEKVKSYGRMLEARRKDVVEAVMEGEWWAAQIALSECISYEAIIDELDFQLECAREG